MKTMKKIVAILAVALMLCSILPLSVFAADTTITFEFGANGSAAHVDGSAISSKSETVDGYTLTLTGMSKVYGPAYDAKGNSCIKLGTSSVVGGFSFTVPADVTSVIINVAKYKSNTSKVSVNGTTYTLTKNSNDGAYDAITVDTTTEKTVKVTTVSGGVRAMVNSITYVISAPVSADCDHDSLECGETCNACGTHTKEHKYTNNCVAECENGCGTANPDYNGGHTYTSDYDASCNTCYAVRKDSLLPEENEALTLAEAIAIGKGQDNSSYTEQKYYITGIITSVTNTTYGNMYIEDAEGSSILIYGLYSFDGKIRYDAMEYKPNVSDEITVYGVIGNYNGTPQMQNGWLDEVVQNCSHAWDNACDTDCNLGCGYTREPQHDYVEDIIESTCTEHGTATYECSVCFDSYDEELPLAAHNYVNDICSACGAQKPAGYTPITSADQFVSGQYILVVNTGHSPSYFENGWVLPSQPVIEDGIIADAEGFLWTLTVDGSSVYLQDINGNYIAPKGGNNNGVNNSEYAWAWTFENGAFTFAGTGDDTVIFACNTDATNGLNRFRGYKTSTLSGTTASLYRSEFTLYAASIPSAPACEHEYDNACDVDCNLCYETREVSHNVVHVDAVAPTCAAMGNIEHWYCDVCGAAWLDAECTLNTTLKSVKLPMAEHTYFDDCSAICEACGYEREVSHTITAVAAKAATCTENGNIAYWYCEACGAAWLDAACTLNTNLRAVVLPMAEHEFFNDCETVCINCYQEVREASHNIVHVDAVAPTCAAMGNLEYWYCDVCGAAWLDAECTQNTNLRAVVLPATGEHTYDDEYDADCNVCGDIREVPEKPVEIIYGDANGDGEITLRDVALLQQYTSGWDVTLDMVAADANGDGEITLRDVALLQQYTSGWDVTLGPVEKGPLFNDAELDKWPVENA